MKRPGIWCDRTGFRLPLHFGLVTNAADFRREMARAGIPPEQRPEWLRNWHADATTHFYKNEGLRKAFALVSIRPDSGMAGIQVAALLVHEAVHIWQECRRLIGESEPSPEFEAYCIQNISQELMERYAEHLSHSTTTGALQ